MILMILKHVTSTITISPTSFFQGTKIGSRVFLNCACVARQNQLSFGIDAKRHGIVVIVGSWKTPPAELCFFRHVGGDRVVFPGSSHSSIHGFLARKMGGKSPINESFLNHLGARFATEP